MNQQIYIVSCEKVWGKHVGLLIPGLGIFHNSPGKGEHLGDMQEFSQGKKTTLHEVQGISYWSTYNRVQEALVQPRQYSVSEYNCEDSITKILEGKPRSPQRETVSGAVSGVLTTAVVGMAFMGAVALTAAVVKGIAEALEA